MDKRLEKIESYIRQYHMIEKGDRIVIGVSGGADSVCLLMALCSLQEKLGFQVLVCHVNHELRGEEAAQDEAYVEMLCHKMQVPFFAFHENVELIAKKRKESLEEAGRYVPYHVGEPGLRGPEVHPLYPGKNKEAPVHAQRSRAFHGYPGGWRDLRRQRAGRSGCGSQRDRGRFCCV